MPYAPERPFPKKQGHAIRSKDWNELVQEALRIERDKVDRTQLAEIRRDLAQDIKARLPLTGGRLTGNLAVTGNLTTTGKANLNGGLRVIGSALLRGATTVQNALTVTGKLTLSGEVVATKRLLVTGPLQFEQTADPNQRFIQFRTSAAGATEEDGFRVTFDRTFFGGRRDALVFEKTDSGDANPDGGFAFCATGSDGERETVLTVRGNGRVGVGTKTPLSTLHVQGTARVTENLTVAKSLVVQDNVTIHDNLSARGLVTIGAQNVPHNVDRLRVWGVARKVGSSSWAGLSDGRFKQAIAPVERALERLRKLRGVGFEWRADGPVLRPGRQLGFIAQEVERVFPEWVATDPDGTKWLELAGFEALVVESLKSLAERVDGLDARLAAVGR